jgi:hypothetical protein
VFHQPIIKNLSKKVQKSRVAEQEKSNSAVNPKPSKKPAQPAAVKKQSAKPNDREGGAAGRKKAAPAPKKSRPRSPRFLPHEEQSSKANRP